MTQKSSTEHGVSELEIKLRTEQKKLVLVQEIGRALSSAMDIDRLLGLIMEKVTVLMEADRSTLYLMSDDRRELWSKIVQGGEVHEIRLNVGEGIAGWVAASGETVNIPDAYTDGRFQPGVDLRSGYRTRSILCVPMRNSMGETIGVLQVLNKNDGPFTAKDEELLLALSGQAAVSIDNSKLYLSVVEARDKLEQRTEELNLLYEIERDITASDDLDELLSRLLERTMEQTRAEAGSIALSAPDSEVLRFRTTAGPSFDKLLNDRLGCAESPAAHRQPPGAGPAPCRRVCRGRGRQAATPARRASGGSRRRRRRHRAHRQAR
jgi:GAF domain-containing protein